MSNIYYPPDTYLSKELSEILGVTVQVTDTLSYLEIDYKTLTIEDPPGIPVRVTYEVGRVRCEEFTFLTEGSFDRTPEGFSKIELTILFPSLQEYKLSYREYSRTHPWVECWRRDY